MNEIRIIEKQFPLADVPEHIAAIRHIIEDGEAVDLTQEGEPVAVLISVQTFQNFRREPPIFWYALQAFRRRYVDELTEFDSSEFDGLQDRVSDRGLLNTCPKFPACYISQHYKKMLLGPWIGMSFQRKSRKHNSMRGFCPSSRFPNVAPKGRFRWFGCSNAIVHLLYTGCQWKMVKVEGLHDTSVFRWFRRWAGDGSLKAAFVESVRYLQPQGQWEVSVLHGEGTQTIAKKGGEAVAYSGHNKLTGSKTLGLVDNRGNVIGTMDVTAAKTTEMVLLADALTELRLVHRVDSGEFGCRV